MTPRGSVTVDSRTNSLLLRDSAALRDTERWLQALDLPLEQVELSAHIVTINEEHLRELGVSWSTAPGDVVTGALRNPQLLVPLTVSNPAIRAGITLGPMSGELLNRAERAGAGEPDRNHRQPAAVYLTPADRHHHRAPKFPTR